MSAATILDMPMKRLLLQQPTSFDDENRSVDAVLSKGSPVQRFYGIEKLMVTPGSVDLSRLPVAIIDSHRQDSIMSALGTLPRAWHADGALAGQLVFNQTPQGEMARGMVKRGEIAGLSIGYRVDEWQIEDGDGEVIDADSIRWGDDDLVFVGKRWQLLEVSLVNVPADRFTGFRSGVKMGDRPYFRTNLDDIRARMLQRQSASKQRSDLLARMHARQRMLDRFSGQ
jgi:hypothetical protein